MLNPSQERAVKHFGKPLLIVAGAGSGKTKTLTYKLEHLVVERGLRQDRILILTFTNKAAREIKDRIVKLTNKEVPWAGTFHSIALKILRQEGYKIGIGPSFSIIDEDDRKKILKEVLRQMNLSKDMLEVANNYITSRRESLREPEDSILEEVYRQYSSVLKSRNLLDFSELLFKTYQLLKNYGDGWRDFFEFVMVDEFQDTNIIQYEMVKLLAKENICVVGDPNQCIYEWRYARPDNMLKFVEDFKPDIIKLEYNYRSKAHIIAVANAVLSASKAQWKSLTPVLKPVRDGEEKPVVRRFSDPLEESLWIAREIKRLLSHYKPQDITILVRTLYLTETFERTFFNARIPYKIVGSVRFFERAEIKDVLAFLKVVVNPSDELSFKRCLENMQIGERTFTIIKRFHQGDWIASSILAIKHMSEEKSKRLYHLIRNLIKLKQSIDEYPTALWEVLENAGYLNYMQVKYQKDYKEREENVKELFRFLEEKKKEGASLLEVLEEVMLISQEEEIAQAVNIMTIHASKGLEFPVVFLPRLEEGILPHEKSKDELQELEEERRLFYVAITRAKDMLYITYTRDKNSKPSRFLSDIPKEHLDLSSFKVKKTTYSVQLRHSNNLKIGDMVIHRVFGKGKVIALEEERATVDFGDKVKTIHTDFLEPIG